MMLGDLPPLTWLRAFEVSARTLSFTAAAAELHVTQAAISKHVKSLEHFLQRPLFIRHPRSLELTGWGADYLPKVQDAMERLALGTREVFGNRRTDVLTIRCAVSFAVNWLAPRLPDFLARHERTPLRVLSSVWSGPFEAGDFDLDIQYGTGDFAGTRSHRLTHETLTPLCAPVMALRLQNAEDLGRERLLHVQGYQEGWGIWLRAAGAGKVDPGRGLLTDTSLAAYAFAVAGTGVALGRTSLATPYRADGTLVAPFDLDVPIKEGFFVLEPTVARTHPDAGAFVSWLLDQCAKGG